MAKTQRERYDKWLAAEGYRHSDSEGSAGMFLFLGLLGGAALALVFSMFVLIFGDLITPGWNKSNPPGVDNADFMPPWYETGLFVIAMLGGLTVLIGEPVQAWVDRLRKQTLALNQDQRSATQTWRALPEAERKKLRSSLLDFLELSPTDYTPLYRTHDEAWKTLKSDIAARDRLLLESKAVTAGDSVKQLSESIQHESNQLRKDAET